MRSHISSWPEDCCSAVLIDEVKSVSMVNKLEGTLRTRSQAFNPDLWLFFEVGNFLKSISKTHPGHHFTFTLFTVDSIAGFSITYSNCGAIPSSQTNVIDPTIASWNYFSLPFSFPLGSHSLSHTICVFHAFIYLWPTAIPAPPATNNFLFLEQPAPSLVLLFPFHLQKLYQYMQKDIESFFYMKKNCL